MKKIRHLGVGAILSAQLLFHTAAYAAEDGKSIYLLGSAASMAGIMPPSGFYFSTLGYYYHGEAKGGAALSRSLRQTNSSLPSFTSLQLNANMKVKADVALAAPTLLWVAPETILGGKIGVGLILPVGSQSTQIDLAARGALTFPNGTILGRGSTYRATESTFAVGDPLLTSFIGWNAGNFHWKLAGLVNIPIGSYDKSNLVNMGFNRWAADLTASLTYLNPQTGFEISVSPGITFNGNNSATRYRSGTEFHIEAAVMQHFSKSFAIGVVGYHYEQLSGDSGAGAVLGPFKGRVSAIGPNISYNFQIGDIPFITSLRWMREFNAKNRLQGDVGMLTITIPFGGGTRAHSL